MKHRTIGLKVAVGFIASAGISLGQSATIQFLGDLPSGEYGSAASAISADGTTVVGWSFVGNQPHETYRRAFRWRHGMMTDLGTLPGYPESEAVAVSSDGTVVTGNCSGAWPFCWSESFGMISLELPTGAVEGRSLALSASGRTIVGYARLQAEQPRGFRWSYPGTVTFLPSQSGPNNTSFQMVFATAISADGEVIYGASQRVTDPWLRYTAANQYSIPSLLGGFPFPNAVSADGKSVALSDGSSQTGGLGRIWSEREGYSSAAGVCAISADGQVSVGWLGTPQPDHAIIWDRENGMRDLQAVLESYYCVDLTGYRLLRATGISADGRSIVGWAERIQNNLMESFLVRLGEPRAGDLNGDGDIDLADLTRLLAAFGSTSDNCTGLVGDLNTDGVVDLSDLTVVLSSFGTICS